MRKEIVEVPGTILKELRTSLNMSLAVAAKKLSVKPEVLSDWETNGVKVSIAKARKIGDTYKRHWTILLLDKIPQKKDFSKEYRRIKANAQFVTETLLAFRNAERILYLADAIEGRVTNKAEIKAFNVTLSSDVKSLTENIRDWLGITLDEQKKYRDEYMALNSWIEKVENKGVYVSQIGIPKEDEISAFTLSDEKRSVIVLNKKDSIYRRIFSLLHELGHILLDANSTFDIYEFDEYNSTNRNEVFCNSFAGSLLIPNNVLFKLDINELTFEDDLFTLGTKYKVSTQVILRRLYDLDYINKTIFERYNDKLSEAFIKYEKSRKPKEFKANKSTYPKKVAKQNSYALTEDAFEAMHEKRISYFELGNLFGVKLNHLPAIEFLVTNG